MSALPSPSWSVKTRDVRGHRDDHLVAEHADPQGAVDVTPLVEDGLLVGDAVLIRVLEDEDPVPLGPLAVATPVVHHLAEPDAAPVVDVDVGGAEEHRLAREERGLEARGNLEPLHCPGQFVRGAAGTRTRQAERGLLGEDEELDRAAAPLVGPAVVDAGPGAEPRHARGEVEADDRRRVSAESVGRDLTVDLQQGSARVGVDADLAESRAGFLPLQGRQLRLARGPDQPGLGPVGPVATDPVAARP